MLLGLFLANNLMASDVKRQLSAIRTQSHIKVDGRLDEPEWKDAPAATDFTTYSPTMGMPAAQRSEVRVIYNDNAIYIGAYLYDDPDSIMTEFTKRDGLWGGNSDRFKVTLNPYNDGQNLFQFEVSTANVQADSKKSVSNGKHDRMMRFGDYSWDAVWSSKVRIADDGWVVEIEIPYAAIRFPKEKVQTWGINFWRDVRRTRETSVWNPVDRSYAEESQTGELVGINSIKAPLRLELYPFAAGYYQFSPDGKGASYAAGMDLKYGLNEAFTLDMTLIPDFGQRKSDQVVLNLTPYEVKYRENRAFFTEGVELFNKAGLFYSRRIGQRPEGYYNVYDQMNEDEEIVKNPNEARLINATKISGRNSRNLGIGVFNAMTANTYATVANAEGETRKILTDPFRNYNMVVLDQIIGRHSFVNLTNTNVLTPSSTRMANVTGLTFRMMDKNNLYGFKGQGVLSMKFDSLSMQPVTGYSSNFGFGKYGGALTVNYDLNMISDTYDPSDMGYLRTNNQITHDVVLSYRILQPFSVFNSISNTLMIGYDWFYNPYRFMRIGGRLMTRATFKNFWDLNLSLVTDPVQRHDYYEPRVPGWYVIRPAYYRIDVGGSTDYRKKVALQLSYRHTWTTTDERGWEISFMPRVRFNDKLSVYPRVQVEKNSHEIGYAGYLNEDSILFGKRDVIRVTSSLMGSYVFNNKAVISLSVRHYWSAVNYLQYFLLQTDGTVNPYSDYDGNSDYNFNIFTVDLEYAWNFAPGSYLTAVWKNNIYNSGSVEANQFLGYWDNLTGTVVSPQTNSFSIKVTYYLDYHRFVRKFAP